MTRVFCFSASIYALLLVHLHPLVTFEPECLIVLLSLSSVQFQNCDGTVARHFGRVPLPIVHRYKTQPKRLLLRPQTVQVESEPEATILNLTKKTTHYSIHQSLSMQKDMGVDMKWWIYLKYSIFPIMLVTDPKEFSHDFPRPEPQLDERNKSVRLKGESVFDVGLAFECARDCRGRAGRSHPSRFTFALWLIETSDAVAMLRAAGSEVIPETLILNWLTPRDLLVAGVSGIRQVVQFTVVK